MCTVVDVASTPFKALRQARRGLDGGFCTHVTLRLASAGLPSVQPALLIAVCNGPTATGQFGPTAERSFSLAFACLHLTDAAGGAARSLLRGSVEELRVAWACQCGAPSS